MHPPERITVEEFHRRCRAQGVKSSNDLAFKCPRCGTVQSMNSLVRAGVNPSEVEKYIAFSCVGRFTAAGPRKNGEAPGRGCDWTCGGLFQIHTLEVVTPDGQVHPRFELASSEEAAVLAAQLAAAEAVPVKAEP